MSVCEYLLLVFLCSQYFIYRHFNNTVYYVAAMQAQCACKYVCLFVSVRISFECAMISISTGLHARECDWRHSLMVPTTIDLRVNTVHTSLNWQRTQQMCCWWESTPVLTKLQCCLRKLRICKAWFISAFVHVVDTSANPENGFYIRKFKFLIILYTECVRCHKLPSKTCKLLYLCFSASENGSENIIHEYAVWPLGWPQLRTHEVFAAW